MRNGLAPRASTWIEDKGYGHDRIGGYDLKRCNLPTILVADAYLGKRSIVGRCLEHSKRIDEEIVDLVFRTLMDYDRARDTQGV
jgi:hypothetical protein